MAILETGQYIKHFQYGCGVIVKRDSARTTIDFDAQGLKIFVTSLMTIEPAEGLPPKRRRARCVKAALPVRLLEVQNERRDHRPIPRLSGKATGA